MLRFYTHILMRRTLALLLAATLALWAVTHNPTLAQPATAPATAPVGGTMPIITGQHVAILPIEGMIYGYTYESLKARADEAIANGATLIVLEMNTNGGEVDAALNISRYLKNLSGQVQTVAWVNSKAYSAGILISAACDEIVMSPASATGDCAVIMPGMSLAPTERAKAYSPVKSEFEDSARRNGYDFPMFDAMCRLGVELYLVEHKQTGERRVVNQADHDIMVNGNPPAVRPIGAAATTPSFDDVTYVVADPIADLGQWKTVMGANGVSWPGGRLHDGTSLFTPNQTTAEAIGLSKGIVSGDQQLQQRYSAASVQRYKPGWIDLIAWFLTRPFVVGLLVLVMVVAGFWELSAPGLGLPGLIAVSALVLLVGAPVMVGLAAWWEVLLVGAGLIMVMIELLFTPTFGLLGIAGLIAIFIGLAMLGIPALTQGQGPVQYPQPQAWRQLAITGSVLGVAFLMSVVGLIVMIHYTGQIPGLNRLILSYKESDDAMTAGVPEAPRPQDQDDIEGRPGEVTVGKIGTVVATLHPTGRVRFEDIIEDVDVVANGGYLEAGQSARVVEVAGNRVVVEKA